MVLFPVLSLGATSQCFGRFIVGAAGIAAAVGVAVKASQLTGVVFARPLPILRLLVLRCALDTGQDSLRLLGL